MAEQTAFEEGPARRSFAMGLMVLSSAVISFGGLVLRNIEAADSWQINLYRAISLTVAILVILLFRYRGEAVARIRAVGRPGLFGGFMLSLAGIAFLQSLTNTTVANTLFTLSAIPFITAVLARVFLKERLGRATIVTMFFAGGGVAVMVWEGLGLGSLFGNVMALVTAVCFSSFAIIVRHNRGVDMLPSLLVSSIIIAVVSFIVSYEDLGISLRDLLLCILWGAGLSGFANWTFIVASRHLIAAEVTLFMLLEFALGPLWVWIFINEVPGTWTLLGGSVVILAVAARATFELRTARESQRKTRGRLAAPP